jgi:choline dehydrogenase-like flavoprotein
MIETRIVVGSGPSSIGVTYALLDRGFDVIMLDAGERLDAATAKIVDVMSRQEPEQWSAAHKAVIQRLDFKAQSISPKRAFGSDFAYFRDPNLQSPDCMSLYGSRAFGGLSTVWGCALQRATAAELSDWPPEVAKAVTAAYSEIRDLLRPSINADIFDADTHLKISTAARTLLERYRRHSAASNVLSIYPTPLAIAAECKACNGCMYGCVYGFTYSTRSTIENLFMHNKRFRYIGGVVVERFRETPSGVEIHVLNRSNMHTDVFLAKQLFLAAGMMGSLRIVWNSSADVARVLYPRDASCFLIPGFLPSARATRKTRHHGLSHLSVDLAVAPFETKPAHIQLYFNNPAVADGFSSRLGPFNIGPTRKLVALANRFFVVGQGYLHSNFCHRLRIECDEASVIKASVEHNAQTADWIDVALSRFTEEMRKLGAVFVRSMATMSAYGSKTAGALPHAQVADPSTTDLLGRPFRTENVFIVDATVMPSIPGRNHTLTTVANALRIGQSALN